MIIFNFHRYMKTMGQSILMAFSCVLLVSCSSSKPVPINDRSSGRAVDQTKNSSKVNPISNSGVTIKSDPVKENKSTNKSEQKTASKSESKAEPKQDQKGESKSDAKVENKPEPKVDSTVPDADFSVARPASGQTVVPYNGGTNKGIDIAGKMGDPVFAGADGKVIFADSFKGYGNTLIVKHNNRFVTVYSHNKTLLVKEGQQIKRGQKIAEMGDSEADRVKLHFEVRRDGKPVDPSGYLQ